MDSVLKQEYTVDHKCSAKIPVPCHETKIAAQAVIAAYPSPSQLPSLLRQFKLNATMSIEEFRQNFLSVTFYMIERKLTYIQVDRKMTWVDLLNQFGGTIGMCLGMSIMSLLELVILCYHGMRSLIVSERKIGRNLTYFS